MLVWNTATDDDDDDDIGVLGCTATDICKLYFEYILHSSALLGILKLDPKFVQKHVQSS